MQTQHSLELLFMPIDHLWFCQSSILLLTSILRFVSTGRHALGYCKFQVVVLDNVGCPTLTPKLPTPNIPQISPKNVTLSSTTIAKDLKFLLTKPTV